MHLLADVGQAHPIFVYSPYGSRGQLLRLAEVEAPCVFLTLEEEYHFPPPLLETFLARHDVAQGMAGGLVIGHDDAQDVVAAPSGAEQRLHGWRLRQLAVSVLGIESPNHLYVFRVLTQGERHRLCIGGDVCQLCQHPSAGHPRACGQPVVAALECHAMREQVLPLQGVSNAPKKKLKDNQETYKEFRDFNLNLFDETFNYYHDLKKYFIYDFEFLCDPNEDSLDKVKNYIKSNISIYYLSVL